VVLKKTLFILYILQKCCISMAMLDYYSHIVEKCRICTLYAYCTKRYTCTRFSTFVFFNIASSWSPDYDPELFQI
jgi:hypothetical protein